MLALARTLNKNPEWLATGAGPESAATGIENALLELPWRERETVLDYLLFTLQKFSEPQHRKTVRRALYRRDRKA